MGDFGDEPWTMVQKKGNQFVVNDKPFYVNGFNTYWLMVFAVDQSTRGKVSEVFQQAASVGLTVCRTWAFNDGQWRALQKSPSVYDEEVFKVLFTVQISVFLLVDFIALWAHHHSQYTYQAIPSSAALFDVEFIEERMNSDLCI